MPDATHQQQLDAVELPSPPAAAPAQAPAMSSLVSGLGNAAAATMLAGAPAVARTPQCADGPAACRESTALARVALRRRSAAIARNELDQTCGPDPQPEECVDDTESVEEPAADDAVLDWGATAPAGADIDHAWVGAPAYGETPGDEALAQCMARFENDWGALSGVWNGAEPVAKGYREALADVEAMGIPVTSPPAKMGDPFKGGDLATPALDEGKLKQPDRDALQSAKEKLDTATRGVEDAWRAVKAPIRTASEKCREAENHLISMDIENLAVEQAQKETLIAEKEALKAATTGAIGGVTKLAKAIYKVDVGDFIEGVGEIAKTGAGLAWDADILAAKRDVTGIKTEISGKKIEQYLNSYTNAMSQSDTALDQATTAHSAWQTAMHTRAAANREMAAAIEKAAGASGRSEADAKNLGLAVRAAPKMEQIVGACERLLPLLALPSYTEESGRGAAKAANAGDFTEHYGILKGYRLLISEAHGTWSARLAAVRAMTSV